MNPYFTPTSFDSDNFDPAMYNMNQPYMPAVRRRILVKGNASGRTLLCGNRPKERLSHYKPILYYPHQLIRQWNKNPDA